MEEPLLWLGTVACAAGAGVALLPSRFIKPRARNAVVATALLLALVLVVGDNWDTEQIADLRDRPAAVGVAFVLGAFALFAAARLLMRWPRLLAPALVAALPFRIPIDLGAGDDPNLLLPLYFVIAAGVLASLMGRPAAREEGPGPLRWIGVALAGFVLLYALQSGYADDPSKAAQNVAFFLVPFAALFRLLADAEWDAGTLRAVVLVLAAEGLLFALIAGVQFATGELFWNDKVIEGNEAHPYFRVNSLFWDPNILGRYLAVTMIALAALVAYGRDRRTLLAAAGTFVILLVPLVLTFSQSSTIALIAGVLVLVAARWGLAIGVVAGLATLAALAASLALIGGDGLSGESSGRSSLVDGGIEIGEDHLIAGAGSGSFADEFEERFGAEEGFSLESHTEPVTVFAEQGAVGVLAYGLLLLVTVGGLVLATGLRLTGPARGSPLAAALLAIYAAMIVHSIGYSAFFSDPVTWATLAIASAAVVPVGAARTAPGPAATSARA